MEMKELSGEKFVAFEVKAECGMFTADVLNKIRKVIDKQYPTHLLNSISMCCDPENEDFFIYRVVLYY